MEHIPGPHKRGHVRVLEVAFSPVVRIQVHGQQVADLKQPFHVPDSDVGSEADCESFRGRS